MNRNRVVATEVRSKWIREAAPLPGVCRPRLLCFPFAGGGASAFRTWPALLKDVADVHAVRLPGREERHRETLPTDIDALACEVAVAVSDWCVPPYAVYGHSMGARLAYRVVHALAEHGLPLPGLLIAAAHRAPHQPAPLPLTHSLPREELIGKLVQFGVTPQALLDNQEMLDFFLPVIRADFALSETAEEHPSPPLDVPILALGGEDDAPVGMNELNAWSQHTIAAFRVRRFAGGHFFQFSSEGQLMELLRDELTDLRGGPAGAVGKSGAVRHQRPV
ncbi:thioesterase domain-containing protein [Streptomyces sp. GZWMJZ-114]|uniref:thioesterase II family protein n=1 Tax=Streptomyces sp. GZWMJZ-114 TaxID=2494734 RepID=UPI0013E8FEC1|nr:thioesterase domain-containing protein [Streptomyces sp. GZWMJZ-114]